MTDVLFLTYRMQAGFGVDVVVANVVRQMQRRGLHVTVACMLADAAYPDIPIVNVNDSLRDVQRLAQRLRPRAIVAHTSPFFELLPALQASYPCWAWEHGDPSPAFFLGDAAKRQKVKDHKVCHVYPKLRGVIAISEFVRSDIGWSEAHVVYNGCDHAPVLAPKGQQDINMSAQAPLRIGTLMRLGKGEAKYKGGEVFAALCKRLAQVPAQFCVLGRGTARDARPYVAAGMEVHLNAGAEAKWRYLRGLDVFVSCNLWEGFNLPLVEAQALGTLGMALDTGAHPEVTPFVAARLDDLAAFIKACTVDRSLLLQHSRRGWHFVRQRFSWANTAAQVQSLLELSA